MPQAQTIDEVLSILEIIIADAERNGNRTGYFAALYHKVTSQVKNGIARGIFNDGTRMERLDVLFANRYLEAFESWQNHKPLTRSWEVAFAATEKSSPLILQHLLLGISAHINLDLGIAAVEVMKSEKLDNIHHDFDTINAIISSLTYEVIHELDRMSPLLSFIGFHANKTNSFLVQFSIGNARDGAWCFAEELSQLKDAEYTAHIAQRDADISRLGASLVNNSGFLKFTLGIIHLFEWKDPKRIVRELYGYKREFLTADRVSPPLVK
jgi:hypothetical protein